VRLSFYKVAGKSESRKKNLMKKIVVISVLSFGLLGINQSQANILYSDNFDSYTSANLVGQGGWAAHSGAGAKPVQVSGGAISLQQSSGSGEDVNLPLGATMGAGDIWYYSFDLTASGSSAEVYFAMFLQSTSNFEGKLFIEPFSGSDFTLGISGSASTGPTTWGSGLSFGTDYRVVVGFNYATELATLWVKPTSDASPSISNTGSYQDAATAIAFRQATPSSSSSQIIDNLVVATTFQEALTGVSVPEPSSLVLVLVGGLAGLVAWRRNR
jgi:hypothetical protein